MSSKNNKPHTELTTPYKYSGNSKIAKKLQKEQQIHTVFRGRRVVRLKLYSWTQLTTCLPSGSKKTIQYLRALRGRIRVKLKPSRLQSFLKQWSRLARHYKPNLLSTSQELEKSKRINLGKSVTGALHRSLDLRSQTSTHNRFDPRMFSRRPSHKRTGRARYFFSRPKSKGRSKKKANQASWVEKSAIRAFLRVGASRRVRLRTERLSVKTHETWLTRKPSNEAPKTRPMYEKKKKHIRYVQRVLRKRTYSLGNRLPLSGSSMYRERCFRRPIKLITQKTRLYRFVFKGRRQKSRPTTGGVEKVTRPTTPIVTVAGTKGRRFWSTKMPKPIRKAAKLESNAPRLHKGALRRKKTIRRFERRKTKQEKRQLRAKALTTSLVQPISASIRVLPELMLEVLRNLPKKLSSSQLLISAAAKRALYRTRRRKLGQSTDKFWHSTLKYYRRLRRVSSNYAKMRLKKKKLRPTRFIKGVGVDPKKREYRIPSPRFRTLAAMGRRSIIYVRSKNIIPRKTFQTLLEHKLRYFYQSRTKSKKPTTTSIQLLNGFFRLKSRRRSRKLRRIYMKRISKVFRLELLQRTRYKKELLLRVRRRSKRTAEVRNTANNFMTDRLTLLKSRLRSSINPQLNDVLNLGRRSKLKDPLVRLNRMLLRISRKPRKLAIRLKQYRTRKQLFGLRKIQLHGRKFVRLKQKRFRSKFLNHLRFRVRFRVLPSATQSFSANRRRRARLNLRNRLAFKKQPYYTRSLPNRQLSMGYTFRSRCVKVMNHSVQLKTKTTNLHIRLPSLFLISDSNQQTPFLNPTTTLETDRTTPLRLVVTGVVTRSGGLVQTNNTAYALTKNLPRPQYMYGAKILYTLTSSFKLNTTTVSNNLVAKALTPGDGSDQLTFSENLATTPTVQYCLNNSYSLDRSSLWWSWFVDIQLVRQKSAASFGAALTLVSGGVASTNPGRWVGADPRSGNLFRLHTRTRRLRPGAFFSLNNYGPRAALLPNTLTTPVSNRVLSLWARKNFYNKNASDETHPKQVTSWFEQQTQQTTMLSKKIVSLDRQSMLQKPKTKVVAFLWASRSKYRRVVRRALRLTAYLKLRKRRRLPRSKRITPFVFSYLRSVTKKIFWLLKFRPRQQTNDFPVLRGSEEGKPVLRQPPRYWESQATWSEKNWTKQRLRWLNRNLYKIRSYTFRKKRLLQRVSRFHRSRRDYLRLVYTDYMNPTQPYSSVKFSVPSQQKLLSLSSTETTNRSEGSGSLISKNIITSQPRTYRWFSGINQRYTFSTGVLSEILNYPTITKLLYLDLLQRTSEVKLTTRSIAFTRTLSRALTVFDEAQNTKMWAVSARNTNLVPSDVFRLSLTKRLVSTYASRRLQSDLIPWYYHTIVRFMEHTTGRQVLVQFYPFVAQDIDLASRARYKLWLPRMAFYERRLGHRFFLEEAIHIMHLSFSLHDVSLFGHWLKAMIKRISFWKTRSIFRFLKYLFHNYLIGVFEDLGVKGLKIKLKGKISAAGNSRKRTILYRAGKTSHATVALKVSHEFMLIHTFTGVMGFQVWLFY